MNQRISEQFSRLPIAAVTGEVNVQLERHRRLVVTAPPGAGKSTLLPLSMLEAMPEGKIIMLEPRRIAARQVAERMARMLGENVGATVGYRVRFESRVSPQTRIEVVTEGILERMLVDDPTLDGVNAVVFDEFHERSLTSDLTLALTREIQGVIRPDLRILVMSATIDAASLSAQLSAPHLHCEGRNYAVEIVHGDDYRWSDCSSVTAGAVRKALRRHEGNILVFLPGQAEIMKCRGLLEASTEDVEILTLYGMMPPEEQRKALMGGEKGRRRVVLASPIAETSLTVEGITVVVDSGLYRTPVFDPATGLSLLSTALITRDMAAQRTGRAGRLGPGTCYRLWSKATESRMQESRDPEILTADLSQLTLTVAAWGDADPRKLAWITPPPAGHLANSSGLLKLLGAVDNTGRITDKGRRIAHLPCHPRIAHMLVSAGPQKALAADIAAFLEEKDPYNNEADSDLSTRIAMLRQYRQGRMPGAWKRIDNIAAQYRRLVRTEASYPEPAPEEVGQLVGLAYPERIAMRDGTGRYRLAVGGARVALNQADDLTHYDFLAIASMGERIFMAAPLDKDWVMKKSAWTECVRWDSREGKALAREELRMGTLTLATRPMKGATQELIAEVVAAAAPKEGLTMFDFNEAVEALQLRIATAAEWHPETGFPDVSTEALLASAGEWLPLYIGKASSVQELRKIDMQAVILGMLSYEQQQELSRIAPVSIRLPSGRTVKIHYRRGAEAPVVSARLQDCFGLMTTPRVDDGKRPVLMELLSPGFKPVQLTQDMEGFWRETYFEVRKELRRRYPKHRWPEDPQGEV